jgi:hypothetical protein
MGQGKHVSVFVILLTLVPRLQAQQLNSVPLNHDAYKIIELGVIRGMILPPPSAKPWAELIVKSKLREMHNNSAEKLSTREMDIVSSALASFERKKGMDIPEGRYNSGETGNRLTFEAGLNWESNFSARLPDPVIATVNKGNIFLAGDIGKHLSWHINAGSGIIKIDRELLGYSDSLENPASPTLPVYGIQAYFPYTFSKPWEAATFPFAKSGEGEPWPGRFSMFYETGGELDSLFFDKRLYFRFGRMRRDWGPQENGGSLNLNAAARPFMAFEGTAVPLPWLNFSFLTGALEIPNTGHPETDKEAYQNNFSIGLLEIETRHFHFDIGASAVYAKRFEPGYIFPIISNSVYQNFSGDFDNNALFTDLELRISDSKIWLSFFVDNFKLSKENFFILNRNMYAYQGGFKANVSWLPFGAFTFRYTKVEPYTYTGGYIQTPWLQLPQNTAYLNNGENIGFYLPPNSDELLARLETMPSWGIRADIQYQLVRHGTDWGSRRVEGSSLHDKFAENGKPEKYFLKDGAYQWDHVIKLGGTYSLKTTGVPVSFYADAGIVITRFTNSDAEPGREGNFSSIDTAEYRAGNHFVFSLGFKVFP